LLARHDQSLSTTFSAYCTTGEIRSLPIRRRQHPFKWSKREALRALEPFRQTARYQVTRKGDTVMDTQSILTVCIIAMAIIPIVCAGWYANVKH
jgi:hypothetical protein